jgi:general secretion pathway protein A
LEQLAQRVIARFHLTALSETETAQYIRHRLAVAGFSGELPFDGAASRRVHRLSRGVPRRINLLCDRALLGAYAHGRARIDRATLDQAAAEVFESGPTQAASLLRQPRLRWALGAAGVLAGAALLVLATRSPQGVAAGVDAALPGVGASAALTASVAPSAPQPASAAMTAQPQAAMASSITLALRDEDDAWRELARAWKAGEIDAGDACEALQHQQLQCFRSDDGMALLRLLARPAILILRDDAGKPFYVKLVGLGSQYATVQAGANTQTVSLVALAKQWRGEFFTLWRAPSGYQTGSMSAAMVDWLEQHLARAFGEAAQPGVSRYGPAMRAKVAAFQRSQGLKVDGLVGPITLMQLSRAAGVDEPRLQADASTNQGL